MTTIEQVLATLPKHIENEKGTKFHLTICTTTKGLWRVCYIWPPRAIKRKGWPVYEAEGIYECLSQMHTYIYNNYNELLG